MKKQITISELKSLIKEEAMKLNRRTILEGEKKKLMEELSEIESPWDSVDDFGSDAWKDRAYDPDINDELKFKVGDVISNTGNDGEFYTMDGKQNFVERPYELEGKIIGIEPGFYIIDVIGKSKEWIDKAKIKTSDSHYREVDPFAGIDRDSVGFFKNDGTRL